MIFRVLRAAKSLLRSMIEIGSDAGFLPSRQVEGQRRQLAGRRLARQRKHR